MPSHAASLDTRSPAVINGYFNGHQVFRILWIGLVFGGMAVLDHWMVNLQLWFSVVTLLVGFLHAERQVRLKPLWARPRVRVINEIFPSPDFHTYLSEKNLKTTTGYPFLPFLWDAIGFLFLIWGTGGISSPFLPLVLFDGLLGSFALSGTRHQDTAGAMTIAVVIAGSVLPIANRSAWLGAPTYDLGPAGHQLTIVWLRCASGFTFSASSLLNPPSQWAPQLVFAVLTTVTCLLFTTIMTSRAANLYNRAKDSVRPGTPVAEEEKKGPSLT